MIDTQAITITISIIGGTSAVLGAFATGWNVARSRNKYMLADVCQAWRKDDDIARDAWRREIRKELKEVHDRVTEVAVAVGVLTGRHER
jgi:hypothetical protein